MVNVVRFPGASKPDQEAAEWVARLDKGLSAEERAELDEWCRADRRNRAMLMELAALWDELHVLSELAALFPLEQQPAEKSRRAGFPWAVIAASVGCVAVLAFGLLAYDGHIGREGDPATASSAGQELRTGIGGQASERLPDGSVVRLNTDTELSVEYSSASRDVILRRGEAYFDVAHDPARPFNVHVGERIVRAVGTAFNVRLGDEGAFEVTVTDGEVRLGRVDRLPDAGEAPIAPTNPIEASFDTTLVEGEVALLDESAQPEAAAPQVKRLGRVDIDVKLAWQRGMLIFRGEPLEAVLSEVGRYTTTEFVLEDDRLRDLRVGGYFRAGDVDALLVALRENFQIRAERVDSEHIILRPAR